MNEIDWSWVSLFCCQLWATAARGTEDHPPFSFVFALRQAQNLSGARDSYYWLYRFIRIDHKDSPMTGIWTFRPVSYVSRVGSKKPWCRCHVLLRKRNPFSSKSLENALLLRKCSFFRNVVLWGGHKVGHLWFGFMQKWWKEVVFKWALKLKTNHCFG